MELRNGLNVINGEVVYKAVADAFSLPYSDVKKFL
jgi:alanine dehydrogenase